MESREVFWEVESFRFAPEGAARDVLRYARTAGLTVRLVRVTREVVESG
jgi:hypothetical protein